MTAQFAMPQRGGFEEMDSPGGPPWSEAICDPAFAKWTLTYDGGSNNVGRLTKSAESSFNYTDYEYDALYRLTSEVRTGSGSYTETHAYDLAGNVTTLNGSAFATYDDANKFSTVSGGSASQDGDGNITAFSGNGQTISSGAYDPRNKLTQITASSTAYNYKYDGWGRRTFRQVGTSGTKTFYIYAGDKVIGEISGTTPFAAYSWGPDGVVSERLLTGTPKSLFYCYGPQGETRNLTDSSGTVVDTYRYNAYGKTLATTGSNANPFRYGGKFGYYTDNEIQTLQVGARWYSPHLIRWMSRDPIHYRGGDNLSAYVMGNPVKYVDPSGLEPSWLVNTPELSPDFVNFMAGLGDSLTLTLTKYGREGLGNNLVNQCSTAYIHGSYVPLGFAFLRLAYAGAARSLPYLIPNASTSMSGALTASAARNQLKLIFRAGTTRRGLYSAEEMVAKYGSNPAAIAKGASRTNGTLNAWASATIAGGVLEKGDCGCK